MKNKLFKAFLATMFLATPVLTSCSVLEKLGLQKPTTDSGCTHVDQDPKDHLCDLCGTQMSNHTNLNNDHLCDWCGYKMSECADANNDGKCDTCGNEIKAVQAFKISVSCPTKIVYEIDKTEAKAGEKVTLTIKEENDGYEVTKVLINGNAIEGTDKVYSFDMPEQNVEVTILASLAAFAVRVNAPESVQYTLSKDNAKPGETVTLTITSVGTGYSIKSVTMNDNALSSQDGSNYSFVMPSKIANISIKVSVSGDIVIEGDISAAFTKESETLYAVRNVKVSGDTTYSKFDVMVTSGGSKKAIGVLALDETRSFADISFNTGSGASGFSISNGYTYDFFYDTDSIETPFYVQRTKVDVMPTSVTALQNLLITGPSIRSEYSVYPSDYVGASYTINDKSTTDVIQQKYEWKLYNDNSSFATVTPTVEGEGDTMYVYKKYDEANKIYQSVDTYGKYQGKKIINDDRYRIEHNNYGPVAGTFEVIDGDDYGYTYKINNRYAARNVKTSAHMPNYFLERDIMYSYRVGFGTENGMNSYSIVITPEAKAVGFNVTIASYGEYTKTAGSTDNTAYKYDVVFEFDARGAITKCNYTEYKFAETEWDFTNHAPKTSLTKGSLMKSIKADYTYGDKFAAPADFGGFKLSDYFVSSFNENFGYYNTATKEDDRAAAGENFVALNDDILVTEDGEPSKLLKSKKFFEPATALDVWQYGPTASTDESVIVKEANDKAYQMSAIAIGSSDVTFGSHIPGFGATKTITINVKAGDKARSFWLEDSYNRPTPTPITTSTSANIKAGGVYSFNMSVSPSSAALIYHAVSLNPELITIASADNAKTLIIDASAASVTSNTVAQVHIDADYQEGITSGTTFDFTILPADVNPLGSWQAVDTTAFPNTYAMFTDDVYEGTVKAGFEGAKKGYIHDDFYDGGKLASSDNYYFYYVYNMGNLQVQLYEIDMEVPGEYSTDPNDYFIDFYYDSVNDHYGIYLAEYEYDTDYEMYWYYDIIGSWGGIYSPEVFEYCVFERS